MKTHKYNFIRINDIFSVHDVIRTKLLFCLEKKEPTSLIKVVNMFHQSSVLYIETPGNL